MQVLNIIFRERAGYQDLYLRPFSMDATPEIIQRLRRDTDEGANLTPSALGGVAGQIIRPVSSARGRSIIANGWDEKRFMFIMRVSVRESRGVQTILEISGYTDHADVHQSVRGVSIPNDLCMYFNSITEISMMYMDVSGGEAGWRTKISNSSHVIAPQTLPNFSRASPSTGMVTQRPTDIFRSDPKDVISTAFSRMAKDESYLDLRHGFPDRQIRLSSRMNDTASRYLHRSFSALATANEGIIYGEGHGLDRDSGQILRDARGAVPEKNLISWKPLAEIAQDSNIMDQGFITYGELVQMSPDYNWDDVKVYFTIPEKTRDFRSTTPWNGRDHTAVAAAQLASGLPSFLAFHQFAGVELEANNMSFGGETVILFSDVQTLFNTPVDERALSSLEHRLKTELFHEMLPWDDCPFDLRIRASLGCDIEISLRIADENPGDFIFPIFCDSLVPPVISNDQQDVVNMGEGLVGIADRFGDARGQVRENLNLNLNDRDTNSGYNF